MERKTTVDAARSPVALTKMMRPLSVAATTLLILLLPPAILSSEEQCRRDCHLPINTTYSSLWIKAWQTYKGWKVGPNPSHGEWEPLDGGTQGELESDAIGRRRRSGPKSEVEIIFGRNGVGTHRPIGPTRPPSTRGHPWFPHDHEATTPSKYSKFCEAGCTFFFAEHPSNTTCKRRCDATYKYDVDAGYNDLAEVARYECYDGCDLGLMRCQPGYRCDWPSLTGVLAESNWNTSSKMLPCEPGQYRDGDFLHVRSCFDCAPGRYREEIKGRSVESCRKCPRSRYVNATGSDQATDCLRCPAGRFSDSEGAELCKCITRWSCQSDTHKTTNKDEGNAYKREAIFEGCDPRVQKCGTSEAPVAYQYMRRLSQYYLCEDKEMFYRRANPGYGPTICSDDPSEDPLCVHSPGTDTTGQTKYLFTSVVSADFLTNNIDVKCDNYVQGDYNYNMEQLVTKKEERGADGMSWDDAPPRGFF